MLLDNEYVKVDTNGLFVFVRETMTINYYKKINVKPFKFTDSYESTPINIDTDKLNRELEDELTQYINVQNEEIKKIEKEITHLESQKTSKGTKGTKETLEKNSTQLQKLQESKTTLIAKIQEIEATVNARKTKIDNLLKELDINFKKIQNIKQPEHTTTLTKKQSTQLAQQYFTNQDLKEKLMQKQVTLKKKIDELQKKQTLTTLKTKQRDIESQISTIESTMILNDFDSDITNKEQKKQEFLEFIKQREYNHNRLTEINKIHDISKSKVNFCFKKTKNTKLTASEEQTIDVVCIFTDDATAKHFNTTYTKKRPIQKLDTPSITLTPNSAVNSFTPDDIDFMLCIINYECYISGAYKAWRHCIISINWDTKEINYYGYNLENNKKQKTQDAHTSIYFEKVGSYMFPNAHIKFKIETHKNDITLADKPEITIADESKLKLTDITENANTFLSQLNEKHITSVCNLTIDDTFIKYITDIGLTTDKAEFKKLLDKLQTSYFDPIDSWKNGKFTVAEFNNLHIIKNAIKSTDIINPDKYFAINENTICKNIKLQPCEEEELQARIKIDFLHKNNKREITIDLCKPRNNTGGSNTFKLEELGGVKYGIRYSFLLYLENTIDLYNALIELIKTSIISHKFMNIKTNKSNVGENSTFIPNVHEICKIGFIQVKLKGEDLLNLQCDVERFEKGTDYNFYIPYIITINSNTQAISKYIDSNLIESVSNTDNFKIEEFIFRLLINIILYLLYAYIELNCIHSDFKLNNIVMNTENNDIYIIDFESLSIYFNYDGQIYYLCQLLILYNNVIDQYIYNSYINRFILRHTYVDTDIYYVLSSLIDIGTVNKDTINHDTDKKKDNSKTSEKPKPNIIGQTIQKYIKMQEYLFTIFSKCKLLLLCFESSYSSLNDNSSFITDLYCFLNDAIKIKSINYNTVNLLFYILHNLYTSLIEIEKANTNVSVFANIKILRSKTLEAKLQPIYLSLNEFFDNKNNKIMCDNNYAINTDVAKPDNSIITYQTDIKKQLDAMDLTFKDEDKKDFEGNKPLKYKSDCSIKSNLLYIFGENIKSIKQIDSPEQQSARGGGKNARIHKYTIKNHFQSKTKKNNKTSKTKLYTNNKNNTSKNYAKHRSITNKLTKQKQKRKYKHTHKH